MGGSTASDGRDGHICLTWWGGLTHDARVIRTAASLAATGARVSVICTDTSGKLPRYERHAAGFSVRRVRRPGPRRLRIDGLRPRVTLPGALWAVLRGGLAHLRLAIAALRTRADVYHAADIFTLQETWLVAKLRRKPIVYEAYEISTDREGFQSIAGLVGRVEGFLARRVDHMFATTGMRADHFARVYGIKRPGVLQNRPPLRRPVASDRLRGHCRIAAGTPIVLYQGGLQPGRGLVNLIEAAARIDDAAFVLLGLGILADSLRERVAALGLSDRVHVLPAVPADELHEWTCSADIGVQILDNTCLNHYTTDSNKLFEYLMAGLPVVASDFPEIRKVVEGHDVGLLVDPADLDAITTALRALIDDGQLRARLRANALAAAPTLSWETQVPALLEAYRPLLPTRRVPPGTARPPVPDSR
jgi:glycosyltransferase involved in cell wall biosynthesis